VAPKLSTTSLPVFALNLAAISVATLAKFAATAALTESAWAGVKLRVAAIAKPNPNDRDQILQIANSRQFC